MFSSKKPIVVNQAEQVLFFRFASHSQVFPLTKDFAEISNNSWVGINGKSRVIQDVNSYDGPYYGSFFCHRFLINISRM